MRNKNRYYFFFLRLTIYISNIVNKPEKPSGEFTKVNCHTDVRGYVNINYKPFTLRFIINGGSK